MAVDLQHRVGEVGHGLHQGRQDRSGSMFARRLLRCRPTRNGRCRQRGRTSRAREHRRQVDDVRVRDDGRRAAPAALDLAAAPGVRVISASAAGTSTSSWASCRRRSSWCGLRRSWTVKHERLAALAQHRDEVVELLRAHASKPKCRWKTSKSACATHPGSSITGGHHWPGRPVGLARVGVGQADGAAAVERREVADVDVTGGHRGHGEGRGSDLLPGLSKHHEAAYPRVADLTATTTRVGGETGVRAGPARPIGSPGQSSPPHKEFPSCLTSRSSASTPISVRRPRSRRAPRPGSSSATTPTWSPRGWVASSRTWPTSSRTATRSRPWPSTAPTAATSCATRPPT